MATMTAEQIEQKKQQLKQLSEEDLDQAAGGIPLFDIIKRDGE